jgi:YfiR/HmsC-like
MPTARKRMTTGAAGRFAAAVVVALALVTAVWAQAPGQRERQIRAALVFKMTRFVTWPEGALLERGPFTFCYVSDDPTAQVLAGIEGRSIQDRRARMRRIDSVDVRSISGCNLLYLAGKAALTADARAAAIESATLIVVDGKRERDVAGMVQLVPRDNRLSLVVDIGMVRVARLRIDATLLQLVEIQQ